MSSKDTEHRFSIRGGNPLSGTVRISGAKNAVLPAMAASLLTQEDCLLENVPRIADIEIMADVLRALGASVEWRGHSSLWLNAANVRTVVAPSELVVRNRASFLVMGPLLGRFGEAASCPPGGDVIGQRPIDVHLAGFRALGADLSRREDKYWAQAKELHGARIFMDYPSNMGTENLLMAAVLARGRTVIKNAAAEPEVCCLAALLNDMGARITGAGTNTIEVEGVPALHGASHTLIPDRIEAGTFALAAAITGGDVTVEAVNSDHLDSLLWKLVEAGVEVTPGDGTLRVRAAGPLSATNVQALPYPGFATDLQSAMGTLLTQARGVSVLYERVYDNRLLYVSELRKLGAEIVVAGQTAIISGPTALVGTGVRALDIRSGAALVLAGLAASGTTEVADVWHLERGYEHIETKLHKLGAHIRRIGGGKE
ncbi:MAG: UDP-N-acetylglucosamine 1-carboxyvinyltransferase [Chloroflexi bacterium]|nr:UDP-N-acetylglucosamine 1-carboxyvinyltransferase [Chloroflexota bacterium]